MCARGHHKRRSCASLPAGCKMVQRLQHKSTQTGSSPLAWVSRGRRKRFRQYRGIPCDVGCGNTCHLTKTKVKSSRQSPAAYVCWVNAHTTPCISGSKSRRARRKRSSVFCGSACHLLRSSSRASSQCRLRTTKFSCRSAQSTQSSGS